MVDLDVLILCGGLGKRLKATIGRKPKALADINGRPFIDIMIGYVASFGFKRFILCSGYRGGMLKRHFHKKEYAPSRQIIFSQEKKPLGTAGAIKNAGRYLRKNASFLVLNGDSFSNLDLLRFLNFHISKKAVISVALSKSNKMAWCGTVKLKKNGEIISFDEKARKKDNLFVNMGIYLMDRSVLSMIPEKRAVSLEYELFPSLVNKGLYGYVEDTDFIDIGTPRNYHKLNKRCKIT